MYIYIYMFIHIHSMMCIHNRNISISNSISTEWKEGKRSGGRAGRMTGGTAPLWMSARPARP